MTEKKRVVPPRIVTLHDEDLVDRYYTPGPYIEPSHVVVEGSMQKIAEWKPGAYSSGQAHLVEKSEVHKAAALLFESGFFSANIAVLIKAIGETSIQGIGRFMKLGSEYADELARSLWDAHDKDWVNPEMKKAIRMVLKSIADSVQDPIIEEIRAGLVFDEL